MADQTQTLATHRRWIQMWHFFAIPVLLSNGWAVIEAIALLIEVFLSRAMPLRAQDRIIRLEERARLERVLPSDLRGRVGELTETQLIAIRFAPDDEVPDLARRA